ncbi:MAG: sugar ABC transporter substrate-binding protein [Limnochordaceae bacterium]|nr:sugar ABC transporter substrate-binding protein [Limnochordaceae bacterium]
MLTADSKARRLVLVLAVTAFLLLGTTPAIKPNAANAEPITVRYAYWVNNQSDIAYMNQVFKEFNRTHQDIQVVPEQFLGDYTKLTTQLATNTAPDAVEMAIEYMPGFARAGGLVPLDSLVGRQPGLNDAFFPALVKGWSYGGKQYGVPLNCQPLVMYYNQDIFDDAGVSYPTSEWDWDSFLASARKLTNPSKKRWATTVMNWDGYWSSFVYANGGQVLSSDGKQSRMNMPETKQALQFLVDLIFRYKVSPTMAEWATMGGWNKPFIDGHVAVDIEGRWLVPQARTDFKFAWDVALLPKRVTRGFPLYSLGVVITRSSKHLDAIWQVVNYVASSKVQEGLARTGTMVAARKNLAASDFFLKTMPPRNNVAFLEMLQWAVPLPPADWAKVANVQNPELQKIFAGEVGVDEGTETIVQKVNALLTKG